MKPLGKIAAYILYSRNVEQSVSFYSNVLSLKVDGISKVQAELVDSQKLRLIIKQAPSESFCSQGFSPMLAVEVPDIDFVVEKVQAYGCHLDGGVVTEGAERVDSSVRLSPSARWKYVGNHTAKL
jgi:predicted enzyme related to lactoylglutathione lyase